MKEKKKEIKLKNIVIGLLIALVLFRIICFANFAIQSSGSNKNQADVYSSNSEIR